ncbi:MAG: methyltransferase domain-containing protein [Proteobacteria bacterium]|nr:methyltransferase domain-containing protein [Pseudomonadota bacterium]
MSDKIKSSYKTSKNIYDDIITHRTWWSKLYNRLFWNGVDDNDVAADLLAHIPNHFDGKLLDVPVGTAVFTYRKYKRLKNADITCLDYSEDMLTQAKTRFETNHIRNIKAIQGDICNLPFEDHSFDIVLSMNGFHAFPDKNKAFDEVFRVLKPGGKFISCFYICGESRISDALVKYVLAPKGWFTPPFETRDSLKSRLEKRYAIEHFESQGAIISFIALKPV